MKNPGHRNARLFKPAFGGQPARRLGQSEIVDDPRQGGNEAQCRHAAPTERSQQVMRGESGEKAAGGGKHDHEAGDDGAVPRRRELDAQRGRRGGAAGEADAYEETQHGESHPVAVRHQSQAAGGKSADEASQDQHRLTSPGIRERTPDQGAADRAQAAAKKHHRGLAIGEVPLRSNDGDKIPDDEKIEKIDRSTQGQQGEDPPIASVKAPTIE